MRKNTDCFAVWRRMRFLYHTKSRNRRTWYPTMTLKVNIHIFGLTKCTTYCKNVPGLSLFFSILLLCTFLRLKELFQVKNGLTTSLLFFFENAKSLGRSDDAKRRKKEDGLSKERWLILYKCFTVGGHCRCWATTRKKPDKKSHSNKELAQSPSFLY